MSFFNRLFSYKQKQYNSLKDKSTQNIQSRDVNAKRLIECGSFIDTLLSANAYISRSDYKALEDYSENIVIERLKKAPAS